MDHIQKSFREWEDAVAWLRDQPDKQDLVRDSYYDDPLIVAAKRYYQSSEWRAISELLEERSGAVLDVGAGRGIASYALAREGYSVTALEPDVSKLVGAGAIEQLFSEIGLPIRIVTEVSEQLPFDDDQFDVVFARAVLHHMQDLQKGCAELTRVLKPGGLLISVREHVISRPEDLPIFLEKHPLHHLYGGEKAYTLKQYRRALQQSGLRIEKEYAPLQSPVNYYPQSLETIRKELVRRVGGVPGVGRILTSLLRKQAVFLIALKVAGWLDNRPGRLYSFVTRKPV